MLNLDKQIEDNKLTYKLEGRLDTATSPELDADITASLDGISELILDMTDLEYISSAGLRVLLNAQKLIEDRGTMTILNTSDEIREIFDITGFSDILNIK